MLNEEIEEEKLLDKDCDSDENDIFKDSTKVLIETHTSTFSIYSSKVNWIVFFFICVFTMGSWLDISGIWCEVKFIFKHIYIFSDSKLNISSCLSW